MAQVLRMATIGGAKTTPFGSTIGTLEAGKAADCVLIDWNQVSYPYLDTEMPLLDAVIQRAKTEGENDHVRRRGALPGRPVHQGRQGCSIEGAARRSAEGAHQRRGRAAYSFEELLPHVRKFYADYIDPSKHEPFYRPSSRV
jgi:5-methylthioadenosine/S-adenosylhomocysteine deaminase